MPTSAPPRSAEAPSRVSSRTSVLTRRIGPGWRRADVGVLVLIALVICGAALRLVGVTWGLPQELHPDEHVIVQGALDLARRHSFEPNVFFRPDHVEIQLSYLVYTVFAQLFFHLPVVLAYAAHAATFLLLSRLVTVVFGLVMIVLAYFIGREFSRGTGLVAAAITAVFPPFVEHSHYATPDVPVTAALMGVVLACMIYLRKPGVASLLIACASTSIAIAIKYPGALAAVVIAVVVIVAAIRDRQVWRIVRHGLLALAGVVVFLFVISPVLFTNFDAVKASIGNESRSGRDGFANVTFAGNLVYYLAYGAGVMGVLLLLAAILGAARVILKRQLVAIPLVLSAVIWVGLSVLPVRWERWSLPMLIAPVILSAIGLVWAWQLAPRFVKSTRVRGIATAVVGVLILSNLLLQSVATDVELAAPDTRIALQDRFAKLGITEDSAYYEKYTPLATAGFKTIFTEMPVVDGHFAAPSPGKNWAVISSCTYARYYGIPQYRTQRAFYALLKSSYPLTVSANAVPATQITGLEPVNDYLAIKNLVAYASGRDGGCDIRAYHLTLKP